MKQPKKIEGYNMKQPKKIIELEKNEKDLINELIQSICKNYLVDINLLEESYRESLYDRGIEGHRININDDAFKEYIEEYVDYSIGDLFGYQITSLIIDYIYYEGHSNYHEKKLA